MKCINIEQKLSELLDGELGLSEKATVETHLESCDSCRNSFANMQIISGNMKQNLAVSAPNLLDKKVLNAFQDFQNEKLAEIPTEERQTQKIGWFGIPKFAFAAALILFGLIGITAFQIGKISASEVTIISPEIKENKSVNDLPSKTVAENNVAKDENTKIIEIPVIKEKIIEVPVIKEKIVTRIVYKERERTNRNKAIVKSKTQNDENFAQAEINKYRIVSELKPKIIKAGETNEY